MRNYLDSQEFYEIAYAYRTAPAHKPAEVAKRFEELKAAIEQEFAWRLESDMADVAQAWEDERD